MEKGGLSGKPLTELSTSTVRDMYKLTNGKSVDIHNLCKTAAPRKCFYFLVCNDELNLSV